MIDSNEPRNGDFVTYVENLVRLPKGAGLPAEGASPGQVPRDRPAAKAGSRWGRSGAGSAPPDIEQLARGAARTIGRVLGRVATFMLIAGIALLAISFADNPPFHVDPMLGIFLAVGGALLRRLAAKAA